MSWTLCQTHARYSQNLFRIYRIWILNACLIEGKFHWTPMETIEARFVSNGNNCSLSVREVLELWYEYNEWVCCSDSSANFHFLAASHNLDDSVVSNICLPGSQLANWVRVVSNWVRSLPTGPQTQWLRRILVNEMMMTNICLFTTTAVPPIPPLESVYDYLCYWTQTASLMCRTFT